MSRVYGEEWHLVGGSDWEGVESTLVLLVSWQGTGTGEAEGLEHPEGDSLNILLKDLTCSTTMTSWDLRLLRRNWVLTVRWNLVLTMRRNLVLRWSDPEEEPEEGVDLLPTHHCEVGCCGENSYPEKINLKKHQPV